MKTLEISKGKLYEILGQFTITELCWLLNYEKCTTLEAYVRKLQGRYIPEDLSRIADDLLNLYETSFNLV